MADPAPSHARRDLTNGPIGSTLLLFALPTLGSNILQSLNGSINSVWVGRFLGEDALAATSNANLIMFLMFSGVFGFGMAATIVIGQSMGRRDVDAARRAMGTAIGLFCGVAMVIAISGWFFAPWLLDLLATPAEVAPMALAYLRVVFIAMPAAFLSVLLMMGLRGSGDSMTPLWYMGLSVVLDSGLNPVFILGLGPAPEMGIAGSAMATAVASYVSMIGLVIHIYVRDLPLRLRGAELGYLKPDRALGKVIVAKGFPMGLQMLVVSVSALAMIGLVNREGVVTTAAYGVTQQLWTYVQMPAMAIGAAVSAMAAQNIGAGRWDRIAAINRIGIGFNILLTGGMLALLTLFDHAALGLFLAPGSPALPIGEHINLVGGWSFILFGITLVLFGTVRANGAVIGPLIILIVSTLPVRLGFAAGLMPVLGADAIWWSFPVGSIASLALSAAYYYHGGWRKIHLIDPPGEDQCHEQALADGEPGGKLSPTA